MATPKKDANPKKARSKKIKPAKKDPPKTNKTKAVYFSWEQWSGVFEKAFNCWKQVLGRYVMVVMLTLGLQILGLFTLSAILLAVFGGLSGLENLLANTMVGTLPEASVLLISLGSFSLWVAYVIYVSILSKVAFYSIIKAQSKEKSLLVLKAYFTEGNRFVWRYVGLSLRLFFYIVWPLIVLFFLFVAWDLSLYFFPLENILPSNLSFLPTLVVVSLLALSLAYVLYAAIRVLFAMPLLVQSDKTVVETFQTAQSITRGAWWFTFLMWGLFVMLLYALNIMLAEIAYHDPIVLMEATNAAESLRLTDLLAFFISLLIFGPITTAFQYYLMLQSARNQSVKI